jgi:hypothetical protein
LLELPAAASASSTSSTPKVFVDSAPEFSGPQIDLVDLSQVDAILISNYTRYSIF